MSFSRFFPLVTLVFANNLMAADITGAGSTFVYPLMAKWADVYKKETGQNINYQSIGSGGGIKQIQNKTVDFGATDMPLKSEELAQQGLMQFPLINGGVVPVLHIGTLEKTTLKFTGDTLAKIFLGEIKKWNDPAIATLNPGVKLPDQAITVVHRSDGSGTTFIWTNYLSKTSAAWKNKTGEGTAVNWPVGVGGKGNEGIASYVKQIDGSIGYLEFAYALQNKMAYAQVKNQAGVFVEPNMESFQAAAASADWTKTQDYNLILTDMPGKKSWPIAGSTFILIYKTQANAAQAKETLKFFKWAFVKGENFAKELMYVPVPSEVSATIEKNWSLIKTSDGTAVSTKL